MNQTRKSIVSTTYHNVPPHVIFIKNSGWIFFLSSINHDYGKLSSIYWNNFLGERNGFFSFGTGPTAPPDLNAVRFFTNCVRRPRVANEKFFKFLITLDNIFGLTVKSGSPNIDTAKIRVFRSEVQLILAARIFPGFLNDLFFSRISKSLFQNYPRPLRGPGGHGGLSERGPGRVQQPRALCQVQHWQQGQDRECVLCPTFG